MPSRSYDIFSGLKDFEPMWLESVQGYDLAYERMKEIAFQKPGSYFVFCTATSSIICAVDTTICLRKISAAD
jgi:hypothetical protein